MNNKYLNFLSLSNKNKFRLFLLITSVLIVLFFIHVSYYHPFISDDAFISLRYADRLLNEKGLTWTDGKPVEGYSNLLWVLLSAFMGFLGFDLVLSIRILGIFFSITCIIGISIKYTKNTFLKSLPAICGGLYFVLSSPISVWAIGGLEQPLLIALLTWVILLIMPLLQEKIEYPSFNYLQKPGFLLGLLSITRPDSIIFIASIITTIIIVKGFSQKTFLLCIKLILLPTLFMLGQLLFRITYYKEWIPNTAFVKFSPSRSHLKDGFNYLLLCVKSQIPYIILAAILSFIGLLRRKQRAVFLLLLTMIITWVGYVALIGGDIFPAYRHYTPIILFTAFIIAEGIISVVEIFNNNWKTMLFISITIIFISIAYLYNQISDEENILAKEERWEWDGKVIGLMLKNGFGDVSPKLAIEPAGVVPYYSQLPALDILGLNDYHIAHNPPEQFGTGWIGHELGDPNYIMSQEPDLMIWCGPQGSADPCFYSSQKLNEMNEFHNRYKLINFLGTYTKSVNSLIFIDQYSSKIGIISEDNCIKIPAYFFNGNPETYSYLDKNNDFTIEVNKNKPAIISSLHIPKGTWRISSDINDEDLLITIIDIELDEQLLNSDILPGRINLNSDKKVNIILSTQSETPVNINDLYIVNTLNQDS